jgi:MFS family permease
VTLAVAVRDSAFRWLTVAFFLETFASVAIGVQLIPYLTDRGDGAAFAAAAAGLIGAFQVVARVLATVLSSRVSQVALTGVVFAGQALAVAILLTSEGKAGILVAVVLLGAGRGVVTLMRPALIADFYGRAHFGAISGMLAFFLTGARALAPVGSGIAYGLAGGYRPVFAGLACVSLLAALSMVAVGRARREA